MKHANTGGAAHAFDVKPVAFALLLGHCMAGADTLQHQAETAAAADALTTLGGAALGAAEANPLGLVTLVAKLPLMAYVKTLPQEEQGKRAVNPS